MEPSDSGELVFGRNIPWRIHFLGGAFCDSPLPTSSCLAPPGGLTDPDHTRVRGQIEWKKESESHHPVTPGFNKTASIAVSQHNAA